MKNLFIVIDGLDGSGKGSMVKRLHNYLYSKDKNYRILTTREPTSGEYGKKMRKILKEEKDPMVNANLCLDLYTKDRIQHLEDIILPFLNKKNGDTINIVICDRYYYSTVAFQNAQGIEMGKILETIKQFKSPDLAIILDIDPDTALKRIDSTRKTSEKFENKEFMETLRKNFLLIKGLLKNENIKVIDATKSKEEVFNEIKKEVERLI